MRLSAAKDSPTYYGRVIADVGGDPLSLVVSIDGARSELVVDADDIEGWADTLYRDDAGGIAVNDTGDGPAIKRVTGRVEFSWSRAQ